MCSRILGILLAVTSLILGQGIKLPSYENEDVLVNCVLESSIKFFQHGHPIAVVPQLIDAIETADSEAMYSAENIANFTFDTTRKCVQCSENFEGVSISKYFDLFKFEDHMIFFHNWSHITERSLWKLHNSECWSIFLASSRNIFPLNTYKSYIIFVPVGEYLVYVADWCIILNRGAKFILVFSNSAEGNRHTIDMLLESSFACYKDVLFLIWDRDSDRVHVKTALPYTPPHGLCGLVRQIIDLDVWIQDERGESFQKNADFRLHKVPNKLRCCIIENSFSNDLSPPYNFIESTPADSSPTYDGVDIRLLSHINEAMTDLENCEEREIIYVYDTILTMANVLVKKPPYPYHSLRYSYFVPKAGTYPRWTWFTAVFSKIFWTSFFVSLGLMAIVMRWISSSRLYLDSSCYKNIIYCLLNAWSVFLGHGASNIPVNIKFRILFLSWIVFTLCVSTVFQTFVTSFFVLQVKEHQIDSPPELPDEEYTVVYDSTLKHVTFYDENVQSISFQSFKHAFQYAVNTPKTALYSTEEFFKYNERKWCKYNEIPRYHKFKHYEDSNNYNGLLFNIDGLLQDKMDRVLQKLATGGMIKKIFNDVVDPSGRKILSGITFELDYEPMELAYLQSCFYCLLCGLSLSLIVFALEYVLKGRCRSCLKNTQNILTV